MQNSLFKLYNRMKPSIIIPVFNEIKTIENVLSKVKEALPEREIIVIDDASTDGTREFLKGISDDSIKIIFNSRNMGKGFCLREGFRLATGEITIIQDADSEYEPGEYRFLIEKMLYEKLEVVYGVRSLSKSGIYCFFNFLANNLINATTNLLYGTELNDIMTGCKIFSSKLVKSLKLQANSFGIEAEITARLLKKGTKISQMPISYKARTHKEGKKIIWVDFFRCLYWLIKIKTFSF